MVFNWSWSDSKFPQVSRTPLSNLTDLNNAVVWMVSTRPLISNSSSLFTNSFVTVPSAPITVGITVNFMFYSFFNSLANSRYLSLFTLSIFLGDLLAMFTIRQTHFFSFFFTHLSVFFNTSGYTSITPLTIDITVTFMFYSFSVLLQSLGSYLSFSFTQWSAGTLKSTIRLVLCCRLSRELVVWPRLGDMFVS